MVGWGRTLHHKWVFICNAKKQTHRLFGMNLIFPLWPCHHSQHNVLFALALVPVFMHNSLCSFQTLLLWDVNPCCELPTALLFPVGIPGSSLLFSIVLSPAVSHLYLANFAPFSSDLVSLLHSGGPLVVFLTAGSAKCGCVSPGLGAPWRVLSPSVLRASAQPQHAACLDIQGQPVVFNSTAVD